MVLNCRRNFLNMISETRLIFSYSPYNKFISLESCFKIDHHVIKLLSAEVFDNILKLQSRITMKQPAGNQNINVSQKKSNTRSICIRYLKVIEGKVSLSTLLGTLGVRINSSFFGYVDGFEKSTF